MSCFKAQNVFKVASDDCRAIQMSSLYVLFKICNITDSISSFALVYIPSACHAKTMSPVLIPCRELLPAVDVIEQRALINNYQSAAMEIEKLGIQAFCLEQMGQTKRAMTALRAVELQNLKQATVGGVTLTHNDPAPMKNLSPLCFGVDSLLLVVTLTHQTDLRLISLVAAVSCFLSQYKVIYTDTRCLHCRTLQRKMQIQCTQIFI